MLPSLRTLLLPAIAALAVTNGQQARANNIQVSNTTLINNGSTAWIQFDLSWQNSWNGGVVNNWDAAWVFVKYNTVNDPTWRHAFLSPGGHNAPAGMQVDPGLLVPAAGHDWIPNPVMGVFIRRAATGTGDLTLTGVQLDWSYLEYGLTYANIAQIQVFAIEMVYVPQGEFAAGSGGTESSRFTLTTINTPAATAVPSDPGLLGGLAGGYPTGQTVPDTDSWPNGFNAFYAMKYEVSQQGYVDFLNTLTYTQQVSRTANAPSSAAGTGALVTGNTNRNGIDIQTPGVDPNTPAVYACNLNGNTTYGEATDGQFIACNVLSWGDLAAYLDWCGLRPMTELEFEKACRGPLTPVANEYPWGTTGVAGGAYSVPNGGANNEFISAGYSTTLGNASYDLTDGAINGPLRVGIFATSTSTRISAGASFYGIMELGGNVWERPVTIGNANGRAYAGTHGDGTLIASGDPDVTTWPDPTTADGAGYRGGAWAGDNSYTRVSDRTIVSNVNAGRGIDVGGRGVRTH